MRDINRIDPFLEKLGKLWKKVPDWRFGQIIENVLGGTDPFFIEDEEMIKKFENYFKEGK